MQRLTQPLLKIENAYQPISFEQAFDIIVENCRPSDGNETLVMSNGDYSNEELYLIQKLARAGLKTNALGSFDYYRRGTAFFIDKNDIVPFAELFASSMFFCILDETANTNPAKLIRNIIDSCEKTPKYFFNTPGSLQIRNWGCFFRSINQYLIQNGLEKGIYINGLGKNYQTYRDKILSEDPQSLLDANGLQKQDIISFVETVMQTEAPVFIAWERFLDERAAFELENLCMLLDIQAKPSTGFLCIKAELNSQGLFDMGMFPNICVGGLPFDEDNTQIMHDLYQTDVQTQPVDLGTLIEQKAFKQCCIFNATGSSIPLEITEQMKNARFSMLHTAFWDETTTDFNLLLPAALPEESAGTYTDTTRTPHNNKPEADCPLPLNNLQQLAQLLKRFGISSPDDASNIFLEYISFFKGGCRSKFRHFFR